MQKPETLPSGLTSLSVRLSTIEEKLNESTLKEHKPSFIREIERNEKNKKESKMKDEYDGIVKIYTDKINDLFPGLERTNTLFDNFTKYIESTVYFVEKYSPIVGRIFNTILKGDSKLKLAIDLLQTLHPLFTDLSSLVSSAINHFVIIMNDSMLKVPPTKSKSKKKSFISKLLARSKSNPSITL